MTAKSVIQSYINNFRRRIGQYLRPGIGLACTIYPVVRLGAILEFRIGPSVENDDKYMADQRSFGSALSKIEQHTFGGDLEGFHFSGTNVIMERNRIIFIKDNENDQWSDAAAEIDVNKIVFPNANAPTENTNSRKRFPGRK